MALIPLADRDIPREPAGLTTEQQISGSKTSQRPLLSEATERPHPRHSPKDSSLGGRYLPERGEKPKRDSLPNAHDSLDILRQRSTEDGLEARRSRLTPTAREGHKFTVGNVGTGGKLYLRPTASQPRHSVPSVYALPSPPLTYSTALPSDIGPARVQKYSIWSDSQASGEQHRADFDALATSSGQSFGNTSQPSNRTRAFSFSTIDETHKSLNRLNNGVWRVVIDRPATSRPRSAEQWAMSDLEVAPPRYGLEDPSCNAKETSQFPDPTYNYTSEWMYGHPKTEHTLQNFTTCARAELEANAISKEAFSGPPVELPGTTSGTPRPPREVGDTSTTTNFSPPMDSETFDRLAHCTDDASVIRYSPKTGAIIAATPARIVAQISSESFMDYDLVSDFFLTFRAYLTPHDLLSLLLARLSWAIHRLENDGRVIRIRTFAALRHWILNYFLDDFALNRKLRVQFCKQINEMYGKISQRVGGGISDLKILQDLKRCWNGRCSIYWDSAGFALDAQQEADILPGGPYGNRDADHTELDSSHNPSSDQIASGDEATNVTAHTMSGGSSAVEQSKVRHKQSLLSPREASPVLSSQKHDFQMAASERSSPPEAKISKLNFATMQPRTHTSPTSPLIKSKDYPRRPGHVHMRSASTSDSTRDQGSPGSFSGPGHLSNAHNGSLIRGSLYPPAPPFVDVIAPESPPGPKRHHSRSPIADGNARLGTSGNPSTKKLMGTIRRALSSKRSASRSAVSKEDLGQHGGSSQGKTSGLPSNMTRSTDNLRDKQPTVATRRNIRIDLLCAAVSQTYQMTQSKLSQTAHTGHGLQQSSSGLKQQLNGGQRLSSPASVIKVSDTAGVMSPRTAQPSPQTSVEAGGMHIQGARTASREGSEDSSLPFDRDSTSDDTLSNSRIAAERSIAHTALGSGRDRRSRSVDTAIVRRSRDGARWSLGHHPFEEEAAGSSGATAQGRKHGPMASSIILPQERQSAAQPSAPAQGRGPSDLAATSIYLSENESESDAKPQDLDHPLRRRPGGDLSKIENVHDLAPRVRRQSTGSLYTRTDSIGSMLVIGGHRIVSARQQSSLSRPLQQPISMIRTHSSQHINPSFEAAVSGFSTIPDDGDGGLEATLLKLEGRYDIAFQRSITRARAKNSQRPSLFEDRQAPPDRGFPPRQQSERSQPRQPPASSHRATSKPKQQQSASSRVRKPSTRSASAKSGRSKASVSYSDDSDSSIPLLERGLFDDTVKRPGNSATEKSPPATPKAAPERDGNGASKTTALSSHGSVEAAFEAESDQRTPHHSAVPDSGRSVTTGSFLLDDDDHLTDLSSELSVDLGDAEFQPGHRANAGLPVAISNREVPTHPLAHPPSPASSFHHTVTPAPVIEPLTFQQKPLTPQPSPTQGDGPQSSQITLPQVLPLKRNGTAAAAGPIVTSAGHIPFILECESVVLAEQLTLVEKAALSEIDWSDLVDMKWDYNSPKVLNWVEYLAGNENRGIDIVVTRFNIVAKWVISEIVMTQNLYERVQVITKYIHVAAHTRRMHNYATMLQITIALTSIDCRRLKATWSEVPETEKAVLKELEALTPPVRNFTKLRIEMETANLQGGCIPFLGLYVHDLTHNSQKPSVIETAPGKEPLVNFERYRTIANIVKSLLRLIDASTRYQFAVVPGVIERCLWLAALDDEKIASLSRSLEA